MVWSSFPPTSRKTVTMDDDVTQWIRGLADGDELAAQKIWDRYCEQLVRLARKRLGNSPRRVADEEDAALSAMHSFFQGAVAGRFPKLSDRHDLWKLLVTITTRKVLAQKRHDRREKRGGGAVRGESVFGRDDLSGHGLGIEQFLAKEPTPGFLALVTDQYEQLLDKLPDELLRRITLYKLDGYSSREIAQELDCAPRTVERKLERIREIWQRESER